MWCGRGGRGAGVRGDARAAAGAAAAAAGGCGGGDRAGAGGGGRGLGHRAARAVGVPAATVRGWLRAFAGRAEQVREVFTALAAALVTDPPLLAPAGSPLADAVAAVAAAGRGGGRVPGVGTVARVAAGRGGDVRAAAGPGWPARVANTSWLWAAPR